MQSQRLPRKERLRGAERFDALFSKGRIGKSRRVLVRALPNGQALTRMAAVAARAAGKANRRNRLRRRLRAAYRTHKAHIPTGWDLVLLARWGAAEADFETLCHDMQTAIQRALGTEGNAGA